MLRKVYNTCLAIILLSFVMVGCATKKHLKEGQFFINKYQVSVVDKPAQININDLRSFFRPKPNSKLFGVRWKLSNYYRKQNKPSKYNKWAFKKFGQEPILYDEEVPTRIAFKMEKYLENIGFFNSEVTYDVQFNKKIANISFKVIPAQPYRIDELSYDVPDSVLNSFFKKELGSTLIKEGDIYNAFTFDKERDRITKELRDEGYYYFNRNFIQYIVDSSFSKHEMSVILKINNVKKQVPGQPGVFTEVDHTRYFLKNVDITPDWKPNVEQEFDTVKHQIHFWATDEIHTYNFLLDQKNRIKPKAFNTSINLKPGKPYSATELQSTYHRLFNFMIIRTATISFDTTGAGQSEDGSYHYINSKVQMQTTKLNSFQVEAEGTNSNSDLGLRGRVVFANKNIFKMGDVFSIRVNGGVEAQSILSGGESTNELFNTFEAGASGNIYFPRFLFPVKLSKFNQKYHPVTNFNFGYSYRDNPDFIQHITNVDFGYTWNQTPEIKHIFTPINFNYVKIDPYDQFQEKLDTTTNQRLLEQYSDHMIFGLNYSFIYSNQDLKYLEHFNYFRMNFESSGNLLYAVNSLSGPPPYREDSVQYYDFFGVRYSQYVRVSTDYRHYYYFSKKTNSLVVRLLLGAAIPFGNSTGITYEKGFYGGGANDMRGWQFRSLGPGGFPGFSEADEGNYERIGEIQIEANLEYRFPVYDWVKGAFFVDAGNIWQLKESETFPDGSFQWDTWYQQIAVDVGVGVRFDFSFFLFRIDMATPIRQPSKFSTGDMWTTPYLYVFNFGIGYPF